jgi:mannose/fructose/N-acetylgalactosamine-specific phosphotransferase system component IIC
MAIKQFIFNSIGSALSGIGNQLFKLAALIGLPITVFVTVFKTFIATTLVAMLEPIGDMVDSLVLDIDINALNVNLSKVNTVFPIPEFLSMLAGFVGLWVTVQGVKWVLKFIPMMG